MKQKMVITNLRIPEAIWLQVKASASSQGISVNEYIKNIIDKAERKQFFGFEPSERPKKTKKKRFYEAMWRIIEKPYVKKPMGASEEDKAIYGIE